MIKQAIEHEYEGYEYYTAQSNKWNSEEITELFKSLAQEELDHAKWLEELLATRTDGVTKRLLNVIDNVGSPKIFDWSNVKNFRFEDIREVLEHARDTELESYEFYLKLKEISDSPEAKELYVVLADWEHAHYEMFKAALELMG